MLFVKVKIRKVQSLAQDIKGNALLHPLTSGTQVNWHILTPDQSEDGICEKLIQPLNIFI